MVAPSTSSSARAAPAAAERRGTGVVVASGARLPFSRAGTDYRKANRGNGEIPSFTIAVPDDLRPVTPGATSWRP